MEPLAIRTTDGGLHWQDITPTTADGRAVDGKFEAVFLAADGKHAWIGGGALGGPPRHGYVLWTDNADAVDPAGVVWHFGGGVDNSEVEALSFVSNTVGWSVGESGNVQHTNDGGRTWTTEFFTSGPDVENVFAVDAQHVWAVRDDGGDQPSKFVMRREQASGPVWKDISHPRMDVQLEAVHFISTKEGWVAGSSGDQKTIWHTVDGGNTWEPQALPPGFSNDITKVKLAVEGTAKLGWAVTNGGEILGTRDGGASGWAQAPSPVSDALSGLAVPSSHRAWAAGDGGRIVRFHDGTPDASACPVSFAAPPTPQPTATAAPPPPAAAPSPSLPWPLSGAGLDLLLAGGLILVGGTVLTALRLRRRR
jgi:photosystem II stability/assembly factor-like uncharacterized protein